MAAAPAAFAFKAPFTVMMPFTMNGTPALRIISASSSSDLEPADVFSFFKKGRPAPSTSMAQAKAPLSFTQANFSCSVSGPQGFTVGMPRPPAFLMAPQAACITVASAPSPVMATMPSAAQPETSTSL